MSGRLLVRAFVCLAIAALFLYLAWDGLFIYFHLDDMMNLHRAWLVPLPRFVAACFNPFTFEVRPVGGVLYRLLFHFAGLDPFPFRVVSYGLILLNLGLFGGLAWRITRSAEIAIIATAIAAYHHRMIDIYTNNGTIYDLLSAALTLAAVTLYVSIRDRDERVRGWRLVLFIALCVLAMNAKEMAATIPLLLASYEFVRFGRVFRRSWPAIVASLAIATAGVVARIVPGGPFHGNEGYRLHIGLRYAWTAWRKLLGEMFYRTEDLGPVAAVLVFAALFAIAFAFRKRGAVFFALFAVLTPIPILFLPYRGFFVMYLPWFGWAACAAFIIVAARNLLRRVIWQRTPPPPGLQPEGVVLLIATIQGLLFLHSLDPLKYSVKDLGANTEVRRMKEQMATLHPSLPDDSRILFVNDGFQTNEWTPVFILRLLYRNPDLVVDRLKMMPNGCAGRRAYTHILTDDDKQIREAPPEYITSRVPACNP